MTQNNKLIEQLRAVTESIMDLRIKQQGGAIITEQHLHRIEMDIFKAMDAATEIAALHPMNKLREEVERSRDEAEMGKYEFEKQPKLTEFIQEMASTGRVPQEWTSFIETLNQALRIHAVSGRSEQLPCVGLE